MKILAHFVSVQCSLLIVVLNLHDDNIYVTSQHWADISVLLEAHYLTNHCSELIVEIAASPLPFINSTTVYIN